MNDFLPEREVNSVLANMGERNKNLIFRYVNRTHDYSHTRSGTPPRLSGHEGRIVSSKAIYRFYVFGFMCLVICFVTHMRRGIITNSLQEVRSQMAYKAT